MIYLFAVYVIFLLFFAIYSTIGIYHLWRFGYVGDLTRPVIVLYSLLSLIIVSGSLLFIIIRLGLGNPNVEL